MSAAAYWGELIFIVGDFLPIGGDVFDASFVVIFCPDMLIGIGAYAVSEIFIIEQDKGLLNKFFGFIDREKEASLSFNNDFLGAGSGRGNRWFAAGPSFQEHFAKALVS